MRISVPIVLLASVFASFDSACAQLQRLNYAGATVVDANSQRQVTQGSLRGPGYSVHTSITTDFDDTNLVVVTLSGSATLGAMVHSCSDAQGTLGHQRWVLPLKLIGNASWELETKVVQYATGSGVAVARLTGAKPGKYANGFNSNFLLELGGFVPANSTGTFTAQISIRWESRGWMSPIRKSCAQATLSHDFISSATTNVHCTGLQPHQSAFLLTSYNLASYSLGAIAPNCMVHCGLQAGAWRALPMWAVGAKASTVVSRSGLGRVLYVQGVVLDPTANSAGLLTTDGYQIVFYQS